MASSSHAVHFLLHEHYIHFSLHGLSIPSISSPPSLQGRVRTTPQSSLESDNQSNVLSLNLFKPQYFEVDNADRLAPSPVSTGQFLFSYMPHPCLSPSASLQDSLPV